MKTFTEPVVFHTDEDVFSMTFFGEPNLTYDEVVGIMAKDYPDCDSFLCVESDEVPEDKLYFLAWYYSDQPEPHIAIDIPKALNIQKSRLRYLREPKLQEADVEFQRALESGDTTKQAEVVAYKTALRDVPELVDGHPEILAMDPKDIVGVTSAIRSLIDVDLVGSDVEIEKLLMD